VNGSEALVKNRAQIEFDALSEEVKNLLVVIVLGIHWDLAWQMPRWLARHKFQHVMSTIVSKLVANALEHQRDPSVPLLKFSLDGQAILALWWMSDVPHKESRSRFNRLSKLARRGQLEIGPALVILDEFLSPEMAILQNLLIGREVTQDFGGEVMRCFDFSDGFGHVAQLAQLVRAFAAYALITRGLTAADARKIAFFQESPDSSRIIIIPQQGGYQSGREHGRYGQAVSLASFNTWHETFGPRYVAAGVNRALYYARKDYKGIPDDYENDLEALKAQHPEWTFVNGTNAEYVQSLDAILDASKLSVRTGDLSGSGDVFVLRGVNAMRMALKLKSAQVYREIISAQTAAGLAIIRRGRVRRSKNDYYFPRHAMRRIWTDYLELMSHDSITGCHSDDVFQDAMRNFELLRKETNWIKQEALGVLAGREASPNHDNHVGRAATDHFALLSLLPYRRQEVAIVPLPKKLHGNRILRAFLNGGTQSVEVQRVGKDRAAFMVTTGCYGSASYKLEQNSHSVPFEAPEHIGLIDNGILQAEVQPNGTLKVSNIKTGEVFEHQLSYESIGDCGDTYTFVPVSHRPYDSQDENASVKHLAHGPMVWEMEIHTTLHVPEHLHVPHRPDGAEQARRIGTVAMKVRTVVRLRAGSRQLEFETKVHNRARDHRLRVVFPIGRTVLSSRAQTAFMVQEYPIRPQLDPNWKETSQDQEPPFNAITNQGLVIAGPMYLANRGITEYEAVNTDQGTELKLTLLRCVGLLSQQGDISTRRGQAGPKNVRVPDAQCQGEYKFEYALGFTEDATDIDLVQRAQCWRDGFEPTFADIATDGLVNIDCGQSVFSSLMPSRDGKGAVAILWNGSAPTTLGFSGKFKSVTKLDLALDPSTDSGTRLGPYKVGAYDLR
jgi:hypothetical protein